MPIETDVVIVGAGPYGLATAAFLRGRGIEPHVFGDPMSFWSAMPVGMLLRSPYVACSIGDPDGSLSLDVYARANGGRPQEPVPLETFHAYGCWFQEQVAPDVDRRHVERIDRAGDRFRVAAGDDVLRTRTVVVAAGIAQFAHRPEVFGGLPPELVSHTADHRDLGRFGGRHLLVVGGGQSALESAALLHEAGAQVELAVREPVVHWLTRRWQHRLGPITRLLYAPPDVGPALVSQLVARPRAYRLLPRQTQERLGVRSLRPAGAAWLVNRLRDVPIHAGRAVTAAEAVDGRARVTFADGTSVTVDHVLLGTGYRVDLARYRFISDEILDALRLADGYPVLSEGFESSVRGLYFVGAPAAWSFGPLMRFVAGSGFAARSVAASIAQKAG
jgi:NADPH-dependent 2,4-dienoyl-CoA reductase/sulfur reductase-like enzyme